MFLGRRQKLEILTGMATQLFGRHVTGGEYDDAGGLSMKFWDQDDIIEGELVTNEMDMVDLIDLHQSETRQGMNRR